MSLAILYTNWGSTHSYIDSYAPFVIECLRIRADWSTAGEVKHDVFDRFGIDLPQGTVKQLLNRSVNDGLAEPSTARGYQEREYRFPDDGPTPKNSITKQSQAQQREIQALIDKLVRFAEEKHAVPLTPESADVLLLSYIDDWALPVLHSSLHGQHLDLGDDAEGDLLIVQAFIVHLWQHDPGGAEYLEALVKGSMLRSALYLPNSGSIEMRFEGTSVYFDTPFLLAALGLKSPEQREAALVTLTLAEDLGAKLSCFTETVSETRGVVEWNANAIQPRAGSGPSSNMRATSDVLASGKSWSELQALSSNLEAELKSLSISIVASPPWDEQDNDLEYAVKDELNKRCRYQRENALLHDVQALISVHRLRNRKVRLRIEKCTAIFITTNRAVVGVGRFLVHRGDALSAPVAMLDHEFATLLWLKKPTAAPDLPLKQVIADCHAALNPSDAIWEMYLEQIDSLSAKGELSVDKYLLERGDIELRRSLMVATGGSVIRVTEEAVSGLVIDLRERIEKPVREESAAAIEKVKAESEKERDKDREAFESERSRIESEARKTATADERHLQAGRVANHISRAIAIVPAGTAAIAVFAGALLTLGMFEGPPWSVVLVVFGGVFGGVVTAVQVFKKTFPFMREKVIGVVQPKITSWLDHRDELSD